MPFVEREAGKIVGLYAIPQAGLTEHLPEDNAEVVAFRNPPAPLAQQLDALFSSLSDDEQADFFTLKAAVNLALEQGKYSVAMKIIQKATVPEVLQAAKSALLAVFHA